jgi:hypothetical protein
MPLRIGVDDSLRPIKDRLREGGYEVVPLSAAAPADIAAIVVNGMSDNILGIQDIVLRVPVINAEGRTPEDVAAEIGRRLFAVQR